MYLYANKKSYNFTLVMFLQGCLCRNTYGFIHDAFMISPVNCILANETFVTNRSSVITTTTWQIQIMSGDMSGQDEPVVLDEKQNKLNLLRYTSIESMCDMGVESCRACNFQFITRT